jgi:hypothetical protein
MRKQKSKKSQIGRCFKRHKDESIKSEVGWILDEETKEEEGQIKRCFKRHKDKSTPK